MRILDDGIYEEVSKMFKIRLSNPIISVEQNINRNWRTATAAGSTPVTPGHFRVEIITEESEISILDDDHCGLFMFEKAEQAIPDNIGMAKIRVIRHIGSKSKISVPYRVTPGTAKPNFDYIVEPKGVLIFEEGQFENFINVTIIDRNRIGDVHTFYMELLQPRKEDNVKDTIGNPTLGENRLAQIGICEDEEMKMALDRLMKMTSYADLIGRSTWKEQVTEAVLINVDGDELQGWSLRKKIKIYTIHILSLPWKLLVALLPPPSFGHGWVAYLSLLALMALVSVLIGDTATYLGCTIGIKDSVTAITLIAFGMGLPDTFASRQAAIREKTADAAIGHITGANTVSVFFGMGVAWSIGSIYQRINGNIFRVCSFRSRQYTLISTFF